MINNPLAVVHSPKFDRPIDAVVIIGCLVTIIISGCCGAHYRELPHESLVMRTDTGPICKIPDELWPRAIVWSPDGNRVVAACYKRGLGKEVLLLEGGLALEYDQVRGLAFSPNGKRLAFAYQQNNDWYMNDGGRVHGPFKDVGVPVFSPNSRHLAFFITKSPRGASYDAVVVDGEIISSCGQEPEDQFGNLSGGFVLQPDGWFWMSPQFSPDSSTLSFTANNEFLVINGIRLRIGKDELLSRDLVQSSDNCMRAFHVLSRDGDGFNRCYVVVQQQTLFGYIEYKRYRWYGSIRGLRMTPNGEHVYFQDSNSAGHEVAVLDGREETKFATATKPVISTDGTVLAYLAAAEHGGPFALVYGGRLGTITGKAPDSLQPVVFAPVGRRAACLLRIQSGWALVSRNGDTETFEMMPNSDGGKVAYPARQPGRERLSTVRAPVFSPNGRNIAYTACTRDSGSLSIGDSAWFVVLDGRRVSGDLDWVSNPSFSDDGRLLGYGSLKGGILSWNLVQVQNAIITTVGRQEIINTIGIKLVPIRAGQFTMGSPKTEVGRNDTNGIEDQRSVTIAKGFYMGTTEVTQAQWKAVMGDAPSKFKGDDLPVEQVSWDDAVAFCNKLSAKEGKRYRLPTEAEWEYACRAGTTSEYAGAGKLDEMGWFADNSGDATLDSSFILETDVENYHKRILANNCRTHPVGKKKANAWGLYDMHGNVWEWCEDMYDESKYGDSRVLRGGCWGVNPVYCRAANREISVPVKRYVGIGFRLVRDFSE